MKIFNIIELITEILVKSIQSLGISELLPQVTRPENPEHGDYSTNICLVLAGRLQQKPLEIAWKIKEAIIQYQKVSKIDVIKTIEIASPGFLNLFINEAIFINHLNRVLGLGKSRFWGKSKLPQAGKTSSKPSQKKSGLAGLPPTMDGSTGNHPVIGSKLRLNTALTDISRQNSPKRVVIEFTDPNPFKEFHIGHLYSNAVGESLARLLEDIGYTVRRVNYQGDAGLHVAKAVWGLQKKMTDEKLQMSNIEKLPLAERVKLLGSAYALGAKAYEEDSQEGKKAKEEINRINFLVFIAAQENLQKSLGWKPIVNYRKFVTVAPDELASVSELYTRGRELSLRYFESIYRRLGTKFDGYYFESAVGELGAKLVGEHLKDGIFEESQGAIVFRGEKNLPAAGKSALHTRVFINKLGLPTYEAKELGLAPQKYADWPYDLSLIVTGNEINEYFKVLLAAISKIRPDLGAKTRHIGHGMVRLPTGKMSSRTGRVLTGEWLIDEVKKNIKEMLAQNKSKYSKAEQEKIAETAAIAAIKYSLLKVGLPQNISFDIEKSVNFQGDSGPYLQYTYARCRSVLQKDIQTRYNNNIDYSLYKFDPVKLNQKTSTMLSEERHILRRLVYFPEIVAEAANRLEPNLICTYLYILASEYNLLYAKAEILGHALRISETAATARTLKHGLYLLGIRTLERM